MLRIKNWEDFLGAWNEAIQGNFMEPCSGLLHEITNIVKNGSYKDQSRTILKAIPFCLEMAKLAKNLERTPPSEVSRTPEFMLSEKAYKVLMSNLIKSLNDVTYESWSEKLDIIVDILTFLKDALINSEDARHLMVYTGCTIKCSEDRENFIEAVYQGSRGFDHNGLDFRGLKDLLKPHLPLIAEVLVLRERYDLIEEKPLFEAIIFLKHRIVHEITYVTDGKLGFLLKEMFEIRDKPVMSWLLCGFEDLSSDQFRVAASFGNQRIRDCLKTLMLLLLQKEVKEKSFPQKFGFSNFLTN